MSTPFFKRIWQKPPIAFPLIALFHVGLLLYLVYDTIVDPVYSGIMAQPVIMLLYTAAWLFVCDMKKWAALVYIALTTLNLLVRFLVVDPSLLNNYTDTLFPADVLFTFFVMFYYKRFE